MNKPKILWDRKTQTLCIIVRKGKSVRSACIEPHGIKDLYVTADQNNKAELLELRIQLG